MSRNVTVRRGHRSGRTPMKPDEIARLRARLEAEFGDVVVHAQLEAERLLELLGVRRSPEVLVVMLGPIGLRILGAS